MQHSNPQFLLRSFQINSSFGENHKFICASVVEFVLFPSENKSILLTDCIYLLLNYCTALQTQGTAGTGILSRTLNAVGTAGQGISAEGRETTGDIWGRTESGVSQEKRSRPGTSTFLFPPKIAQWEEGA